MIGALSEPSQLGRVSSKRPLREPDGAPRLDEGATDSHEDAVTSTVLAALVQRGGQRRGRERRSERRYPFPHPVYLTPFDADGPRVEETVQVLGKHLSEHGLDFYHREPLPYRRMIASLEVGGKWMGLLLDLKWCRFTSDGLYDNGGRFVDAVPSPLAT